MKEDVQKYSRNVSESVLILAVPAGLYGFHEDTVNKLLILSIPLAHKKSSLVFFMPYHVESLERLEKLLTCKQLDDWMGKLKETAVAVSLPKVSMEVSHNIQVLEIPTDDTGHCLKQHLLIILLTVYKIQV